MSSDNIIVLRVSRDGSANYINPTQHDIGGTGQFCGKATRTRLGNAEQLVIEIEDSSFYKNDIIYLGVAE